MRDYEEPKACLNRCVLSFFLKRDSEGMDLRTRGRAFQSLGAVTPKARSPFVFSLVLGTTRSSLSLHSMFLTGYSKLCTDIKQLSSTHYKQKRSKIALSRLSIKGCLKMEKVSIVRYAHLSEAHWLRSVSYLPRHFKLASSFTRGDGRASFSTHTLVGSFGCGPTRRPHTTSSAVVSHTASTVLTSRLYSVCAGKVRESKNETLQRKPSSRPWLIYGCFHVPELFLTGFDHLSEGLDDRGSVLYSDICKAVSRYMIHISVVLNVLQSSSLM